MRTVQIGVVSSAQELQEALGAASTEDQVFDMTEFLASLASIEASGFRKEAKRWRATTEPAVKVFSAAGVGGGQQSVGRDRHRSGQPIRYVTENHNSISGRQSRT